MNVCRAHSVRVEFGTSPPSTDGEVALLLEDDLLPGVSSTSIEEILSLYPAEPAAGSPFGTGDSNVVYPEYKRVAAILGDLNFHGPRRFMMQKFSGRQPAWSYCECFQ